MERGRLLKYSFYSDPDYQFPGNIALEDEASSIPVYNSPKPPDEGI
jgi:hypothetical protein